MLVGVVKGIRTTRRVQQHGALLCNLHESSSNEQRTKNVRGDRFRPHVKLAVYNKGRLSRESCIADADVDVAKVLEDGLECRSNGAFVSDISDVGFDVGALELVLDVVGCSRERCLSSACQCNVTCTGCCKATCNGGSDSSAPAGDENGLALGG